MYRFDTSKSIKINQVIASKVIGITQPNLSKILRGQVLCRKVVAFSIVKYICDKAEIEDYFIRE